MRGRPRAGPPACSRAGGCGQAAPYLEHGCCCLPPSPQCGSAPGPPHAGPACSAGAVPARRPASPSPGPPSRFPMLPHAAAAAAAESVRMGAQKGGQRPPSRGREGRPRAPHHLPSSAGGLSPLLSPAWHPSGCTAQGPRRNCPQRRMQSPSARDRGRFIAGGVELRQSHGALVLPVPGRRPGGGTGSFSGGQDVPTWAQECGSAWPMRCLARLTRCQHRQGCAAAPASHRASGCRGPSRG